MQDSTGIDDQAHVSPEPGDMASRSGNARLVRQVEGRRASSPQSQHRVEAGLGREVPEQRAADTSRRADNDGDASRGERIAIGIPGASPHVLHAAARSSRATVRNVTSFSLLPALVQRRL